MNRVIVAKGWYRPELIKLEAKCCWVRGLLKDYHFGSCFLEVCAHHSSIFVFAPKILCLSRLEDLPNFAVFLMFGAIEWEYSLSKEKEVLATSTRTLRMGSSIAQKSKFKDISKPKNWSWVRVYYPNLVILTKIYLLSTVLSDCYFGFGCWYWYRHFLFSFWFWGRFGAPYYFPTLSFYFIFSIKIKLLSFYSC